MGATPVEPAIIRRMIPRMNIYYVNRNAQSNGDHEVHVLGCSFFPAWQNAVTLGPCPNCQEAIRKARQHFSQCNGCAYCVSECNTD